MANEDHNENGKKIIDSEITKVILNTSLIESDGKEITTKQLIERYCQIPKSVLFNEDYF